MSQSSARSGVARWVRLAVGVLALTGMAGCAGAPPTVSFAGGLFGAGELILGPLRAALGFDVREPLGDGLAGAARLAAGTDRFASLVHGVAP